MAQPLTMLVAALGGEGGGVLAEWLFEMAVQDGYPAQSTSIPGVAQRTGATTYYVEIFPEAQTAVGGRRPVLSLLPVPGCVDLVIASELLEAVRNIEAGMVSHDRTVLVSSTSRTLTTAEKLSLGDERFEADRLLAVARKHSRRLVTLDMEAVAREAACVPSAVMFGAIAASGVLPFARERFESAIRASGIGVDASLRGFALAFERIESAPRVHGSSPTASAAVPADIADAFPVATHDIVRAGHARLVDYQGADYAELYLRRLTRVLAGERRIDPTAERGFALTRETARFLALWMAFDDIVRVAQLKCRASRFARVRGELGASKHDVVRIVDYFKPRAAEIAGLLPKALAQRMLEWDRKRAQRGKESFALPLRLRTDGVLGFCVLRLLSSLHAIRKRGARYAHEQDMIERWLAAIESAARSDWSVAHEIALCGRLIKGYGATNERGKANLSRILDALAEGASFATASHRSAAIRSARESALEDEGGKALDRTLARHGVAPRPIVPQPIRWTRKPARASKGQHRAA